MSTGRQRRPGLKLPGLAAEQDQIEQAVIADFQGAGDRTQLIRGLGDRAGLDRRPFGNFHPGQLSRLFDGKPAGLAIMLDGLGEDAGPEAAEGEVC
jgi:hypothetical protein